MSQDPRGRGECSSANQPRISPTPPNPPALPDGYQIGDHVICCIEVLDDGAQISIGDKGTVLGPSTNSSASDADRRIQCMFSQKKSSINMLVSEIRPPLPKGYKVGDRVICCIQQDLGNRGSLSVGDEGIVATTPATRDKSEPDAHKRISCNFPTKMTQVDVLVTQILPPSEFRDYLEQTMVLRTVRPVQRLLLAAMTLRTTQDSSNDQSAVQVRL